MGRVRKLGRLSRVRWVRKMGRVGRVRWVRKLGRISGWEGLESWEG
jgi:hypothetical protein